MTVRSYGGAASISGRSTYTRALVHCDTMAEGSGGPSSASESSAGEWRCCLAVNPSPECASRCSVPIRPVSPFRVAGNTGTAAADATIAICSTAQLEHSIESHLFYPDNDNDDDDSSDEEYDPVTFKHNDDGHLLKCRRPTPRQSTSAGPTILGIEENQSLYEAAASHASNNLDVAVTFHRPEMPLRSDDTPDISSSGNSTMVEGCGCTHPSGNWDRNRHQSDNVASYNGTGDWDHPPPQQQQQPQQQPQQQQHSRPRLRIVDLTELQFQRRRRRRESAVVPLLNGPGNVCHLLRSILTCSGTSSHFASPWLRRYGASGEQPLCQRCDEVVALLMLNNQTSASSDWETVEQMEVADLMKFRAGDASPSYYLYSVSQLNLPLVSKCSQQIDIASLIRTSSHSDIARTMPVTMLVYRRLSPRDKLSTSHPMDGTIVENSHDPYCLWETFQPPKTEESNATRVKEVELPPMQHRLVAPPYQAHADLYPGLFDEIMKSENIRAIVEEALNIPQWTAWPEKNHYASADDDEEDEDAVAKRENSPYPATWTVFPLCHTFPARDVSNRKWITKTCNFVPRTTALLEGLGPALRTALFSRLEPRTTLSAHTGWADLANHVLRVHIPIVVPSGTQNEGLCGTWVDGCVETHKADDIICFDDSKVHRAFNYTDEERIVLIVDLARADILPVGTATGGHTDELDKFIKELT